MHFATALCTLGLALTATAHMILNTPAMFPNTHISLDPPDQFENGPLMGHASTTSNYPCKYKGPGSYDFAFARTQMPLGSNQTLSFTGSAVHGGGSCQLSLTKDLEPTAQSVFKVIHSIEGGCPARNANNQNLPGSASSPDPNTYDYTIPASLDPGQYTFAWTWFNKVGNREMYMNCAPIEITGASAKRSALDSIRPRDSSYFDSLPDMFLANIPDVDCTTAYPNGETASIKFPNPGSSVEVNADSPALVAPVGTCYAPVGSPSGSTNFPNKGASPAASSAAAVAPIVAPTTARPLHAGPVATPTAPASAPSLAPAPAIVPPAPAAGSSPGSCLSGHMPCTGDALVCIGSTQFGLCNFGCMIPQAVAAGTSCSNGAIMRRRRARSYPPQVRSRVRALV